jgi:20S proteasome alpha/beta subunit
MMEVPRFISPALRRETSGVSRLEDAACVGIGADSRTTMGSYIANRVTDKLTYLHERIYCCRSGSDNDPGREAVLVLVDDALEHVGGDVDGRSLALCDGVIGADSRTTMGSYIANRVTDKLTYLHERIYCCRDNWAWTTSATAWVSAAEPERQQ